MQLLGMAVLKNLGISATLQKFWRFFWQLHHDDEDVEMMSLGRSILTARRPIRPAAARLSQPRRTVGQSNQDGKETSEANVENLDLRFFRNKNK